MYSYDDSDAYTYGMQKPTSVKTTVKNVATGVTNVKTESYHYNYYGDIDGYSVVSNGNTIYRESHTYDIDTNILHDDHFGLETEALYYKNNSDIVKITNTLNDENNIASKNKYITKSETTWNNSVYSKTEFTYSIDHLLDSQKSYLQGDNIHYITTSYEYFDGEEDYYTANPTKVTIRNNEDFTTYVDSYQYDLNGNVIYHVDARNKKSAFSYDAYGNKTLDCYFQIGESYPVSKFYNYDYVNNKVEVVDENNHSVLYNFNSAGYLTKISQGSNTIAEYTYDKELRPIEYIEGKATTTFTYDSANRVTSEVVKEGSKTLSNKLYEYATNATGLQTKETIKGDTTSPDITNIIQSDILGRTVVENKAGDITNYTYDMMGNVVKEQEYRGKSNNTDIYFTKDYTYDYAGNVLSVKETDGTNSAINTYASYDMIGRMITSTDAKGNVTTYKYNALGQVTEQKAPFSVDGSGNVQYTYNTYIYDAVGNLTRESATNGVTNNYTYDYRNRLTEASSGSQKVNYVYDDAGNIVEYKTANGTHVHKYEYNALNRVTTYTDALGKSETYVYDNNNDMISKKDRNGKTITYTYDGLHRVLTEKANGVNNSWTYSMTGTVKSESNANVSKTYTYNNKGLVSTENTTIGDDTFTIQRYYDTRGNNTNDRYLKNNILYQQLRYTYDNRNRLRTVNVSEGESTTSSQKAWYGYDVNDNLVSANYGNNTKHAYYYNAANLVTHMDLINKSDNSKLEHLVYNYRLDGNMSSKNDTYGGVTVNTAYTYDSTGRLTKEAVTGSNGEFNLGYTYDNAGNRTAITGAVNKTYSYDANNRLLAETSSYNTVQYTYDNNGNQTKKETYRLNSDGTKTVSQTENFAYNGLNQLVNYDSSNGTASNDKSASYKYMANGYRLSKTLNYTKTFVGAVTEETRYLWDKDNIVAFMDSSNDVTHRYYRGYQLLCDDEDMYYMHDPHGNVIETYNPNQTTPYDKYLYNAFGTQNGFEDTDMIERSNEWGYCDQLYDNFTDNYYMRAREYSYSTGRFITEDPIRDGSNWYAYCNGNPVMFIDPSGLSDIYIFYYNGDSENGSLSDRAYNEYNYLVNNTNFSVEIKGISTQEDFKNAWNNMDNNGKSITKVSIYMHSNSRAFITTDGGVVTDSHPKANTHLCISELDTKEIYSIHMFACNSAHLDRINSNIAYEFASNQNVQYVYGWDGSMDWNRITGNPQLASSQEYFVGNIVGEKRNPEGQIVYKRNKLTGAISVINVVTGRCYGVYDVNGNKLVYEQSEPTAG